MSSSWRSRYEALAVAIAPAGLLVAMVAHPFIEGRLPNDAAVAAAVAADTSRWGLVHLAAAGASGLVILAFLAIRDHLGTAGEHRFSAAGLPFVVIGSTLFALLPGMEFAALAAAETGADVAAAQAAVQPWFVAVLATSALTFAVGVLAFARAIATAGILSRPFSAIVGAALVVMALSRAVPFAVAQFYVQSLAGLVALWPLALHMWSAPAARAGTLSGQAQPLGS